MSKEVRTEAKFFIICLKSGQKCEHHNCVHFIDNAKGHSIEVSFCNFARPASNHISCQEVGGNECP